MDTLKQHCIDFLQRQNSDALAFGVLSFEDNTFSSFQLEKKVQRGRKAFETQDEIFFDLASLSKPLTNSLGYFCEPSRVNEEMTLLLNHRGGLPAWGLLPNKGWRELIKSFPIKESDTLYSDFSALRFMLEYNLECNETSMASLHEIVSKVWNEEVLFWKDLTSSHRTVQNGFINGKPNFYKVHDPNALVIDDYVSHAGLFGSISGVCKTLLNFNNQYDLVARMDNELSVAHERFVLGWDTVSDTQDTLAGNGCGQRTFGHLGFTGTSIWIDASKKLGHVLLTNTTKEHWHDRTALNNFRKSLGEFVWSG